MKTETKIKELTQEDLVNLLCTATYDSNYLTCYANDREGIGVEDGDCIEDIWAKALLAGKKIVVTDFWAQGEHYGPIEDYSFCHDCEDGEDECEYRIGLQDIINGLQRCADGTFNGAEEYNDKGFLARCYNDFVNDGENWDYTEADALMQVILFNELIYG